MLVLTRKLGEMVVIGDNIQVTVLAIRGNQVRLGFAAPTDIPIRRSRPCEGSSPSPGQETRPTEVPAGIAGVGRAATPAD
jgi:carbon storage regulator